MKDPFAGALPGGRLFGKPIRIHWLFPFVALAYVLHVAWGKTMLPNSAWGTYPPGSWIDASVFRLLLFFTVLLHEFGHSFPGRWGGGEANQCPLRALGHLPT